MKNSAIFNSSKLDIAYIYAPAEKFNSSFLAFIKNGSAMVGFEQEGFLKLYYEGNLYDAVNLHDPKERIKCAAGRMFNQYPTTAFTLLSGKNMKLVKRIGSISANYQIEIIDEQSAEDWFASYKS